MHVSPHIHAELARQRQATLLAEARTSRAGIPARGDGLSWRRLVRLVSARRALSAAQPQVDVTHEQGEVQWSCT